MSNNELRNLALLAKQRLKSANYKKDCKNKNIYNQQNSYFIKNITAMRKLSGQCEFVTITDEEDLKFLKRVYSMLKTDEDVYNPIGRLIDQTYFSTLNDTEKQQYVFNLADKYGRAREKYFLNHITKNG